MAEALGLPDGRWRGIALMFNTQPAAWLHDSWFDVVPQGAMLRRLRAVPQAAPCVSGYLLRAFGLERVFCEDFASPWARLALLDGAALEDFFLHLGLTLRSEALQRELSGEQRRLVKQAVGAEGLNFATKRAPLLGAIPLFPFEPAGPVEPRTRLALIGVRFCVIPLTPLGQPLLRRLTLKLPAAWSATLNAPLSPAETPATAFPPLLRKLLKDRLPTWNPLFT